MKKTILLTLIILFVTILSLQVRTVSGQTVARDPHAQNPLVEESTAPFHAPRFDLIRIDDFMPALEYAMAQKGVQIEKIILLSGKTFIA